MKKLLLLFLIHTSCSHKENTKAVFEIIGSQKDDDLVTYTVYTDCLDSILLKSFADSLIRGKRLISTVAYFDNREGTPLLNPNHSYVSGSKFWRYFIADYKYDSASKRFILKYNPERVWIKE